LNILKAPLAVRWRMDLKGQEWWQEANKEAVSVAVKVGIETCQADAFYLLEPNPGFPICCSFSSQLSLQIVHAAN
jgi:hypothetical protein